MYYFSLVITIFALGITTVAAEEGFVSLFDGKTLDGWHSARHPDNITASHFSVNRDLQAIHVYADAEHGTKQQTDNLYTQRDYSHFILRLEYKWGEKTFQPRVVADRDAGVLFHIVGNLNKVWPHSLEMQLGASDPGKTEKKRYATGDLWVLGKPIHAKVAVRNRFYDPAQEPVVIGEGKTGASCFVLENYVDQNIDAWNQIEIEVHGAERAIFKVNGQVVLELFDFGNGDQPLSSGRISLQAEWAEILYRNIMIKELQAGS